VRRSRRRLRSRKPRCRSVRKTRSHETKRAAERSPTPRNARRKIRRRIVRARERTPPSTTREPVIDYRECWGSKLFDFSTLEKYVTSLPDGLDSYPDCRATGATFRNLLSAVSLPLDAGLPAVLEKWIRAHPSENEWLPVVHLCALHAAVFDSMFAHESGMAAYVEWTFQRNKTMLAAPVYAPIVTAGSPELLLAAYRARWSVFYRGCTLDAISATKTSMTFRLSYPAYCWPEVSRLSLAAAFRAGLTLMNAQSLDVRSSEISPRASQFDLRWS
jgi:hypothetical protein